MTDLLDDEAVEAFKDAIRDVTDTFHKYPVILEQDSGDTELLAGRKIIAERLKEKEEGGEIDEGYEIAFNREYLKDRGLVDENDNLLIVYDDRIRIDGKRYHVVSVKEKGFREDKIMVILEVIR